MLRATSLLRFTFCLCAALFSLLALADEKPLHIAMVQWRGETIGGHAFKEELKSLGYNAKFTELDAKQDREELGRILRHELSPILSDVDYVYSYGTTVSLAVQQYIAGKTPHIFNSVANPSAVGLVTGIDKREENISGTSVNIPLLMQLEMAKTLFEFNRLGVFFNPQEKNSVLSRDELHALSTDQGFNAFDIRSTPGQIKLDSFSNTIKRLNLDAVFVPLDSHMLTHSKLIGKIVYQSGIPSIGTLYEHIQNGILIGVVPDFAELGRRLAEVVHKNQGGTPLSQLAIIQPDKLKLVINRTTAKHLSIKIPKSLVDKAVFID